MSGSVAHIANWWVGWGMILAAFVSGAVLGLRFHDEGFLGGYGSFRRRVLRLGHIALAALGMMNVMFALSPVPGAGSFFGVWASVAFMAGGIAMPVVCFLTAYNARARTLFPIPVALLVLAVVLTLMGGVR